MYDREVFKHFLFICHSFFKCIFSSLHLSQVPIEVRTQVSGEDPQHGTLEAIKVKMLSLGPMEAPSSIRLEFSSEADLFFHYVHCLDEDQYRQI